MGASGDQAHEASERSAHGNLVERLALVGRDVVRDGAAMVARDVPVLDIVGSAGRVERRNVSKRKHAPLVLALELLHLEHVVRLDRRVLLEREARRLEEVGRGLDACADDDGVGGEDGAVLEVDGADARLVLLAGGEVRQLGGEDELGALGLAVAGGERDEFSDEATCEAGV